MAKIGFVGLGNMGLPMAGNLVKGGHEVKGYDIFEDNLSKAAQVGVKKVASAAEAAKDVDFVVTMVPTGKETLELYQTSGFLAAAKKGTLFIDASTIDVAAAKTAHDLAKAAGMLSLDAPVSGGTTGAQNATLTFMCGGSKEAYDKAVAVLGGMGKKLVHCGEAGMGQATKICNNMMMAICMFGVCEGFALGEKLGISHQTLFDVVSTSTGNSFALSGYCPVPGPVPTTPANRDYAPGFMTKLMVKDLMLAQQASQDAGVSTPMGALAQSQLRLYMNMVEGAAEKDFSSVMNFVRGKV